MRASTRFVIIILLLVLALVCLGSSCKLGGPEALKSVTFNPNGGKGTMVSQTFTNGTTQKLATNTFTRDGYTFQGWNTSKNGEGTSYADNADFTYDSRDSGITLFAQWGDNGKFTIEYIDTINPYVEHVTQDIMWGSIVNLNTAASMGFVYANNSFIEWTAKIGGKEYSFNDGEQVEANFAEPGETVEFSSHWLATLNFNAMGGSGTISAKGFETLKPVDLPAITFEPPTNGEYLGKWCTAPCIEDGILYDPSTTTDKLNADTTMYALLRYKYPEHVHFTINKTTVIEHRQQNTVTNPAELDRDDTKNYKPMYVIVATGPVYSNGSHTEVITKEVGTGKYGYVSYDYEQNKYKAYSLEDSEKSFYKDDSTDVIIIYNIPRGYWTDTLPSKSYMEKWGNPEGSGMDGRLLEALSKDSGWREEFMSGSRDEDGKYWYYYQQEPNVYSGEWKVTSAPALIYNRFQTALF